MSLSYLTDRQALCQSGKHVLDDDDAKVLDNHDHGFGSTCHNPSHEVFMMVTTIDDDKLFQTCFQNPRQMQPPTAVNFAPLRTLKFKTAYNFSISFQFANKTVYLQRGLLSSKE